MIMTLSILMICVRHYFIGGLIMYTHVLKIDYTDRILKSRALKTASIIIILQAIIIDVNMLKTMNFYYLINSSTVNRKVHHNAILRGWEIFFFGISKRMFIINLASSILISFSFGQKNEFSQNFEPFHETCINVCLAYGDVCGPIWATSSLPIHTLGYLWQLVHGNTAK